MSYAVPSLRKVYAGGPAMATQMQIETGNTPLTYNHPEASTRSRASAEDPYYHAIGINEGNLDGKEDLPSLLGEGWSWW